MKRFTLMTLVSLMLVAFAVTATAAQPICQSAKIKSFDFLVDDSGSMMMPHKRAGQIKMIMARTALLAVNERIPELGYTGSVRTFAPNRQLVAQQTYNRGAFAAGFNRLRDTGEVFGRLTPMGDGIAAWTKSVYASLPAPAAVILVSDGENNRGSDPLAAARAAIAANPDLTFHVISVADTKEGQATLDSIAKLKNGTTMLAENLVPRSAHVDEFVRAVFCGARIVLRSVQFAFDSAVINRESAAVLDELANILRKEGNPAIMISGHTCNIGSAAYNQGLSERRSAAVKAYLVKQGLPANNINTRGFGLTQPKFDNSTEEGRRLNRRAEIDFR